MSKLAEILARLKNDREKFVKEIRAKQAAQEAEKEEEEELCECELCMDEVSLQHYVGCCRDGECEHDVEHMCDRCAFWNISTGQWECGDCHKDEE